jgi:hypothetical protein
MSQRVFSSLVRCNSGRADLGIDIAGTTRGFLEQVPDDGLKTFQQCQQDVDNVSVVIASWVLGIKDDPMTQPLLAKIDALQQHVTAKSSMISKAEYDDNLANLRKNLVHSNDCHYSIMATFSQFKLQHGELIDNFMHVVEEVDLEKDLESPPSKKAKHSAAEGAIDTFLASTSAASNVNLEIVETPTTSANRSSQQFFHLQESRITPSKAVPSPERRDPDSPDSDHDFESQIQ